MISTPSTSTSSYVSAVETTSKPKPTATSSRVTVTNSVQTPTIYDSPESQDGADSIQPAEAIQNNDDEIKTDNYIAAFVVFLPISAMIISEIGRRNFRRENARTYETIATLIKVEKLLGFHEEIEEKDRFLKKDKYVLPNYFIEINEKVKSHDTKYFIDWMIDREAKLGFGKFYSIFNYLFFKLCVFRFEFINTSSRIN